MPRHFEKSVSLAAGVEQAFEYLDDFEALSAHMLKPSAMMLGSSMVLSTDALGGRAVGSKVRMAWRMLGMSLALEEVVTERSPPLRKAWRTLQTRLWVIGDYVLGFELQPAPHGSSLRVFIDYERPAGRLERWLATFLGAAYARWCVNRMAADAVARFGRMDN